MPTSTNIDPTLDGLRDERDELVRHEKHLKDAIGALERLTVGSPPSRSGPTSPTGPARRQSLAGTDLATTLTQLVDQQAQTASTRKQIAKAIGALEALSEKPRPNTKRAPRPAKKALGPVPEHLQGLSTPQRLTKVMATKPDKASWTTNELALATHTGEINTVRTALARMQEKGQVTQDHKGNWCRPAPTDVTTATS